MMRQDELELAVDEYLQQNSDGHQISVKEFIQWYPELHPELREYLDLLVRVQESPLNHNNTVEMNLPALSGDCLNQFEIQALRHGNLSEEKRKQIESHLEKCSHCREEVQEQSQVDNSFRGALQNSSKSDLPKVPNHIYIKKIGKGGQGEVWLARHESLKELRAIKLIRVSEKSLHLRSLKTEVKALSKLPRHKSRVVVHDLIEVDQTFVMIMEYIPGGSLDQLVRQRNRLDWKMVCQIGLQLTYALQDVHDAGIFHRDIKPGNVLYNGSEDRVVLIDFGLAVLQNEVRDRVGTPGYLAPELGHSTATIQTEIFALGATLYCLLTGSPPFDSKNPTLSLQQARVGIVHLEDKLPHCPAPLLTAIRAAIEPDPSQRISCRDFAVLLRQAVTHQLLQSLSTSKEMGFRPLQIQLLHAAAGETELNPLHVHRDRNHSIQKATVDTGDVVRFNVHSTVPGYLTVLNRTENGQFETIFPGHASQDSQLNPSAPRNFTLRLAPPSGDEWFLFLWDPTRVEWTHELLESQLDQFHIKSTPELRSVELLENGVNSIERRSSAELYLIQHRELADSSFDSVTTRSLRSLTDEIPEDDDHSSHFDSDGVPQTHLAIKMQAPPTVVRGEELRFKCSWKYEHNESAFGDIDADWILLFSTSEAHLRLELSQKGIHQTNSATMQLPVHVSRAQRFVTLYCLLARGENNYPLWHCRIEVPVSCEQLPQEYRLVAQSLEWQAIQEIYAISTPSDAPRISTLVQTKLASLRLSGGFQQAEPRKRWESHLQKKMSTSQLIVIFDSDKLWTSPWAVEELYAALKATFVSEHLIQIYRIGEHSNTQLHLPANLQRIAKLPSIELFETA